MDRRAGYIILEKEVRRHKSKHGDCGVIFLPEGLIGQKLRIIINVRNVKRPFKYIKGIVKKL